MKRNQHQLFIAISMLSLFLTALSLFTLDGVQGIASMLTVLLPVLTGLSIVLLLTRKRRLGD